ncbi:MAG: hypothetical protein QM639_17045 [Rhodocyclaceae bacterium]
MWGKVTAGILLGLPLTVFGLGALTYALPGPWQDSAIGMMLLFAPAWMGIIAASANFRSGPRAWGVLAFATAAAFGAQWLAKFAA